MPVRSGQHAQRRSSKSHYRQPGNAYEYKRKVQKGQPWDTGLLVLRLFNQAAAR